MKKIQGRSILLTIIITSQLSYITARPGEGMSAHDTNRNQGIHNNGGAFHKEAIGGLAIHNNNGSSQIGGAAALGMAGMAAGSQNSQGNSSGSQGSTAPTTPPAPIAPTPQTPAPTTDVPAPTTEVPALTTDVPATTPVTADSTASTPTDAIPEENKDIPNDKEPENNDTIESQITHDEETIVLDHAEILDKLKTINLNDNHTHDLLTMAGMDQLFNNFVYFKNFIVHNFTKDKMLSLCTELINQIYPKENTAVITMASAQTNTSHSVNTQEVSTNNDVSQDGNDNHSNDSTSKQPETVSSNDQTPTDNHESDDQAQDNSQSTDKDFDSE